MTKADAVTSFHQSLPKWYETATSVPQLLLKDARIVTLADLVGHLRRRLRDGPLAPSRAAFFGPTGAGKSKIFCSVIGRPVSSSGFVRPFTRRPSYFLHEQWRALAASLDGDVELHSDDRFASLALIDTPDFDSVEAANRQEAERIFAEVDSFIFVTDGLKYADASTWEYLERIERSGKPVRVIINKADSDGLVDDFRARWEKTFGQPPSEGVVGWRIPDLAIDDETLIDADQAVIASLRAEFEGLSGGDEDRRQRARRFFGRDLHAFFESAAELGRAVEQRIETHSELKNALVRREELACTRLREGMSVEVDKNVKNELYEEVLEKLEHLDILRYPRKILAMPIDGVRSLIGKFRGRDSNANDAVEEHTPDPALSSESFQLLESTIIEFCEQARREIAANQDLAEHLTPARYRQLRPEHEQLLEEFKIKRDEFREWAATHAKETAAQLTGQNKLKFLLSQLLFNSVIIGAQIQTGGAFTLVELGVDGVLSPLLAKAVGIAVSSDKVREFEAAARVEQHRKLSELISGCRENFESFLSEVSDGLDDLSELLEDVARYRSHEAEILDYHSGAAESS